jgi:hypothetical protein
MTDVTVVVRLGLRRNGGRESVCRVVVGDERDVVFRVVATQMAEVERASAREHRERCGHSTNKETITCRAEPHPFGL